MRLPLRHLLPALVIALLSTQAWADTYYNAYRFATIGVSGPVKMNNNGQFSYSYGDYERGFYETKLVRMGPGWQKERLDYTGYLGNVVDINDMGTVLASSSTGNQYRPATWDQYGLMNFLNAPANGSTSPSTINNDGTVIGTVYLTAGNNSRTLPLIWRDQNYALLDLGGADQASPRAINIHGDVVGSVTRGQEVQPALWHNGVFTAPSVAGWTTISTLDINDEGWIAGHLRKDSGPSIAAIWRDGEVIELGTGYGVWRMNENGDVIGSRYVNGLGNEYVLWKDGQQILLDSLLNPAQFANWRVDEVYDFNDHGQLMVQLRSRTGYATQTVLLSPAPIPEPGGYALLIAGLAMLAHRARKSRQRQTHDSA